ncbi:MAG TPA: indole-3-glycerol-phosphate synthase [Methanomassiliicoccales archaeon]|jgi:indole-3-glycerol phosphate synthase
MPEDTLERLVRNAELLVASDYYDIEAATPYIRPVRRSLAKALQCSKHFPIIAEVKLASPSNGNIALHDPGQLIAYYLRGGATALSVLTEPKFFKGSLGLLDEASSHPVPVIMKDFVISRNQVEAAARHGASAILLIQRLFSSHMVKVQRDALIGHAHDRGLEVLLEAADEIELLQCLKSSADVVGINQRDLRTMAIEDGKGVRLLNNLAHKTRPIIVMSGISAREQVEEIRKSGAAGVLIGTELAASADPENRLRGLVVPR